MRYISEAQSAALIDHALALQAVGEALMAASEPTTTSFPAVLGHGSDPQNRFSVKSAATTQMAGLKLGSYWPSAQARGLPRHNSTILLLDQTSGRIDALIEAGLVNAYRTAAADAAAANVLARCDASTLAIFGAGHQAAFEIAALRRVRRLSSVLVVSRDAARGEALVADLSRQGLSARRVSAQVACEAADIIVTATAARVPLFEADWVQPGAHVASMGSDAKGKQELPPALFQRARLFCDLEAQSRAIGEFQHARHDAPITPIGAVLAGRHPARRDGREITVFDSSGIALQDLFVACRLLALHDARQRACA